MISDAPQEAFLHHARCLRDLIDNLQNPDPETRYRELEARYEEARAVWPEAAASAAMASADDSWIAPLLEGLRSYGQDEGWA